LYYNGALFAARTELNDEIKKKAPLTSIGAIHLLRAYLTIANSI